VILRWLGQAIRRQDPATVLVERLTEGFERTEVRLSESIQEYAVFLVLTVLPTGSISRNTPCS